MLSNKQIFYSSDEHPKPLISFVLVVQYLFKFAILLSLIHLLISNTNASVTEQYHFLSLTLIAAAIATALQALKKIGPGMLFPAAISVPYFAAIMLTSEQFGWPTVVGMTIVGSVFQLMLIPIFRRYNLASPAFIGLITFLIAIWLASLGVQEILYNNQLGQLVLHPKQGTMSALFSQSSYYLLIGLIALICMLVFWQSKKPLLRMSCILSGMFIAWLLAQLIGQPAAISHAIEQAPYFYLPDLHWPEMAFSWQVLPYFLVAALVSALEIVTLVSIYHMAETGKSEVNVDYLRIQKSNRFVCISNIFSSLLGVPATGPVPGAIGTSIITGVFSRSIAFLYSAALIAIAFSPKAIMWFFSIPAPANGAALIILGLVMLDYALHIFSHYKIFSPLGSMPHSKIMGIALTAGCITYLIPAQFQQILHSFGLTNPSLIFGVTTYLLLSMILRVCCKEFHRQ